MSREIAFNRDSGTKRRQVILVIGLLLIVGLLVAAIAFVRTGPEKIVLPGILEATLPDGWRVVDVTPANDGSGGIFTAAKGDDPGTIEPDEPTAMIQGVVLASVRLDDGMTPAQRAQWDYDLSVSVPELSPEQVSLSQSPDGSASIVTITLPDGGFSKTAYGYAPDDETLVYQIWSEWSPGFDIQEVNTDFLAFLASLRSVK